jgi:regulatory protein
MVLEEFSPETEETVEKIREIIERKYPAAREDEKVRRRAIAALQRYGYKLDDIFAVINEDAFE